jgi:putative endonuclease
LYIKEEKISTNAAKIMSRNKKTGIRGEEVAIRWLTKKGYTIIVCNWRYKRWEIDIIAGKDEMLHFVEVKSRSTTKYGYPEAGVNIKKLTSLKSAVEGYLNLYPEWSTIQIDVLTITWRGKKVQEIFMIEDIY